MQRIFLILCCVLLVAGGYAQSYKKYSIKPLGYFTDLGLFFNDPIENNDRGNSIEIDRLISPRVSIGLIYLNYWNLTDDYEYISVPKYNAQIAAPGSTFHSARFNAKVSGVLFSSKYYFNDADEEGHHSFYIGSEFGALQINAKLYDILVENNTMPNNYTKLNDRTQKLYVSKLGGKFGYSGSGEYLSSDISIGVCNNSLISSQEWSLPYDLQNISIHFTWLVGFNF